MRWGLPAILLAYVVLSIGWNVATPPYEVSDETSHVIYAEAVARGSLPVLPSNNLESAQPPGYYVLAAAVIKVLHLPPPPPVDRHPVHSGQEFSHVGQPPFLGGALTVRVLRLLSTCLGLVALFAAHFTLRRLLPPAWALSGTALIASIPQFVVFTSGVNNDALSYATGAAVVACGVMAVRSEGARRCYGWTGGMGAALGLMFWSKEYAFAFIPLIPIALLLARNGWRTSMLGSVFGWAVAVVVALPLFIRDQILYHQPWPFAAEAANLRRLLPPLYHPRTPLDPWMWTQFPWHIWASLWFSGGWTQINWPLIVYVVLAVIVIPLMIVGVVPNRDRAAWVPMAAVALLYIGSFYSALTLQQFPGRYLLPAATGLALAITLGVCRVLPTSVERAGPFIAPGMVLLLNLYALWATGAVLDWSTWPRL